MTLVDYDPLAAPGAYPLPAGRGRWRVTLHDRQFSSARWDQTIIGELADARSRSLTQQWNQPAEFRFTVDGHDPAAAVITELAHEVMAWRWDDRSNVGDVCVFRGPIDHSEDHISAQRHTVNFVAHDYLATLDRRFILDNPPWVITATEQDQVVRLLVGRGGGIDANSMGYTPGSYVPVTVVPVTPAGFTRSATGTLRDRTYIGQKSVGQALAELAAVSGGFDFDLRPSKTDGRDALRVFWPSQGVARTDVVFVYGGNVSEVTRTVNSADYANFVRSLGNNATSDPAAAQLAAIASNSDASGTTVGFWPYADSAPSDVNQQATLDQRAQGLLASVGILVPSYTLSMRPGSYSWAYPNMGDTVPLIIQSGRLNVNTTVRVVGITYDIGDDGDEDVEITVGRPLSSLTDLLARTSTAVDALARR